jgi:hypothetical protein
MSVTLINSATSALFYIQSVNIVNVHNFTSYRNKNMTIMNINDVKEVTVDEYTCYGDPFLYDDVVSQS